MTKKLIPEFNGNLYLLYSGSSSDGRGEGTYIGRTTDIDKAIEHFNLINKSTYSTGKVVCVTDTKLINLMWDDDWFGLEDKP